MLFNSFSFLLIFFPITCAVYWALKSADRHRLAIVALLLASYVFYVVGEKTYPYLIVLSIGFNFFVSRAIRARSDDLQRRLWLTLGVGGDLAALAFFKYTNFVRATLAGWGILGQPTWHVALPIGISFFTFTQIAFLVDVYRNKADEYDPANYGLFVTFFPHLIAGPILHHSEMMPQFASRKRQAVLANLADGLPMLVLGLAKKTLFADGVAPTANVLFGLGAHGKMTFLTGWIAALAYAVQIYFDFSGYSDMAIGLGRCFGIDLPINFNSPYKARSIADFWRRWHITLSRFLRDYLYIPLGGNRRGEARRYFNLLVTMVLGGLWHGAGWTFGLWGLLHGLYLAGERGASRMMGRLGIRVPRLVAMALTLLAVFFAWVPFRAPSLGAALRIWEGMLGFNGIALPSDWAGMGHVAKQLHMAVAPFGVDGSDVLLVVALFLASLVFPNSQEILGNARLGLQSPGYEWRTLPPNTWRILTLRRAVYWACVTGAVFGVCLRTIGNYSAFIYFQF